jgi:hypothetical protein|nr:hypothetical protein [Nonlabens sp. Ci31]
MIKISNLKLKIKVFISAPLGGGERKYQLMTKHFSVQNGRYLYRYKELKA